MGGKTVGYALSAMSLAVALGAATTAEARSITGVERIVSSGEMSLNVTLEAGEPGDSHALYIAYDTEDKGVTLANWAALQRGCNVADDATSATIPVSPLLIDAGYTVCRVFLTTSAAPYDTQLEYLRQSGTQYIDTGIRPDGTSVAVMDTKFDSNATRQQRFFGVSSNTYKSGNKTIDDTTAQFSFDCYINGSGNFATACKDGKGDWQAAGPFTTDRVRISLSAVEHHHVTITNLASKVEIANATYNTTCTKTSITSVLVFAQHFVQKSAVSIDNIAQGANLYSFSITTNSELACDYKPCKLGDRVGVYDSVTDTIIYSASGTDFDAANSGSPVACSLLAGETPLAAAPSATGLCVYPTWIGGASGSLSVGANWSTGVVPTGGNCIIGNVSGADLTVGDTFAPTAITFPVYTGPVTISGERTLSGIVAITNNAPFHHVFNCPIVCANDVTPDITRGKDNYMTFAGGITMYDTPKTGGTVIDYWSGNVTLTTTSPVRYVTNGDQNYGWLVSGTTFTCHTGIIDHMYIDAGATAVVERLEYNNNIRNSTSGSRTAYFNEVFDNGNGTIRTKEVKNTGTAVLFHSYADSDMVGGTIIAEKLTCATTVQTGGGFPYPVFMLNCGSVSGTAVSTGAYNGEGVWVIGPGGLAFGETIHARSHFETKIGKSLGGRPAATLHSYADWTLQASPNGRNTIALSIGSGNGGFIVIDTSHYAIGDAEYDSATSHTVTLDGQIVGGPMRVEGNGKVVFANEYNTFSGLTVTNTATASVKAGCKPGTGAVTVNTDATLEVAESGTATIDGALTLAEGAALAFNFTEKAAAPVLAVATPATLPATVNVKVSAAGGLSPSGGQYTLTSGGAFTGANVSLADGAPKWVRGLSVNGDGNLVLDVKPKGTMIIVR